MPLFSTIGSLPYPALTDPPNAQTAGASLTTALDAVTLPQFASAAAVTAAIPSPTNGQRIVRTDVGLGGAEFRYSSGSSRWIPHEGTLLAENTVSGTTTSSVTFSSIPQDFRDLRLVVQGGCGTGGSNLYGVQVSIQLNGDTTQNNYVFSGGYNLDQQVSGGTQTYGMSAITGTGGTVGTAGGSPPTSIRNGTAGDPGARIGLLPGPSLPSVVGTIDAWIHGYTHPSGPIAKSKHTSINSGAAVSTSWALYGDWIGGWAGTTAINSLTVGLFTAGKYRAGTILSLYGY